jgi:hypothetical protein
VVSSDDPLFHTRWVHIFEEDAGAGAVYRPDTDDVPLSRRPRAQLTLSPDGTARVTGGGPDDRPVDMNAEWTREGDELVVRANSGHGVADRVLRVSMAGPARLLVRKG